MGGETKNMRTHPAMIANNKAGARNKSGIKGVYYDKNRSKWAAEITFQRHKYHLGRFTSKDDAVKARLEARDRLHGKFLEWYAASYPEQWDKVKARVAVER